MQHAVTAKKGKKRASYIRSIISNKLNARSHSVLVVNFQYVTLTFFAVLTRAFTSLAAFTELYLRNANACFEHFE